jgi:hypothetical protein
VAFLFGFLEGGKWFYKPKVLLIFLKPSSVGPEVGGLVNSFSVLAREV